jgi:SAM-dependent methyltransferase
MIANSLAAAPPVGDRSSAWAPATGQRLGKVLEAGNPGLRACARSGEDRIRDPCARLWVWRRALRAHGRRSWGECRRHRRGRGLLEIATERTPEGDFWVGDLEALPWPEDSFDVVTGFSSFQFADDKVRALTEARRVSRESVAVAIPSRVSESGITLVFKPLFPLFPPEALESMKHSGMFALSEPGKLEEVLDGAGLTVDEDDEIEKVIVFDDAAGAVRAFVGAGPTALAIVHSGELAITQAVREALSPFTGTDGRVTLAAWYRVVIARG